MFYLFYFLLSLLTSFPWLLPLIIFLLYLKKKASKRRSNLKFEAPFKRQQYAESSYFKQTGHSYEDVRNDLGKYGEYLIYEQLKHHEAFGGKFLFNLYIPKPDGKTTEIDVVMIMKNGIFIFESKNFSGWIFGSENQKEWVQTLSRGRYSNAQKNKFYNPIIQNDNHIKHLRKLVGYKVPIYSIIAFSERCTLMGVNVKRSNAKVVNRYDVGTTVNELCNANGSVLISDEEINRIYFSLNRFVLSNENLEMEQKHIEDVSQYKINERF